MLTKMRIYFCQALASSKGSFTLEATIVFPLILFILFCLLFVSMFIFEKLVVLNAAVYTSAQRAATWNNSFKDLETGALGGKLKNNGLYWRIFQDSDNSSLAVAKAVEATGLAGEHLAYGVFQNDQTIEINYNNQLIKRTVTASINENVLMPAWAAKCLGNQIQARAQADVAEPVEYIRNVDILYDYLNRLKGYLTLLGKRQDSLNNGGRVYITKNIYEDKVYHSDPNCRYVQRISRHGNLMVLESTAVATEMGYRQCKVCTQNNH
ncbi:hypothetical protein [Thermincola ferriacetica]